MNLKNYLWRGINKKNQKNNKLFKAVLAVGTPLQ